MATYYDDVPYAEAVAVPATETTTPTATSGPSKSFKLSRVPSKRMGQAELRQLTSQGYTKGMAEALFSHTNVLYPLRVWVIDNSGSMSSTDGTRLVETSDRTRVKTVDCTRWRELQDTVTYHARMAGVLGARTIFRMLNNPGAHVGSPTFEVVSDAANGNEQSVDGEVDRAAAIMVGTTPSGVTPLTRHVREIRNMIAEPTFLDQLTSQGQRVVIVLATDGLPTDEHGKGGREERRNFVEALRSLEGLPVWVVVRLCTNDDDVVDFYNDLDAQLELSVEVLDDFLSEAAEVHRKNPWLNYALPLHRCREMGYHDKLFDLLDERRFTKEEVRNFCCLLFGHNEMDGVPDPEADWSEFLRKLDAVVSRQSKQWNPVKKKVSSWISMGALKSSFDNDGCVCS